MAQTVFLLPGQGAYSPGALAAVATDPRVAEVLAAVDQAAAEAGRGPVSGLLTDPRGPGVAQLSRNDPFALQLAVFAVGAAGCLRAPEHDRVIAGHSMGEIAALTVAGAFDLLDGARLVGHRALALLGAAIEPGGMLAADLTAERAAHVVGALADRRLAVSVLNAPSQTVISGPEGPLTDVALVVRALGARAVRLNAPYAFHSPTLRVAVADFLARAAQIRQHVLRADVYSPVAGRHLDDDQDLKALLARQLHAPVDFLSAVRTLHAEGAQTFVECGSAGLGGLVRAAVPGVTIATVDTWPASAGRADVVGPASAGRADVVGPASAGRADVVGPASGEAVDRMVATDRTAVAASAPMSAPVPVSAPAQVPVEARPVSAPIPAPVVAGAAVPADVSSIGDQLRELYAATLGYPVEAITLDADLEADLGIDSLKRAEMLGKVTTRFGLSESVNDGRFLGHETLGELAGMVAATMADELQPIGGRI